MGRYGKTLNHIQISLNKFGNSSFIVMCSAGNFESWYIVFVSVFQHVEADPWEFCWIFILKTAIMSS